MEMARHIAALGCAAWLALAWAAQAEVSPADRIEFKARGDRAAFRVQWNYPLSEKATAALSWEMRDLDGPVVARGEEAVELAPGASGERVIARPTAEPVIEARFTLKAQAWQKSAVATSVDATVPPRAAGFEPNSPWGIGLYHHMYSAEEYARALDTARDAGVTWVREAFHWDEVNPEPGKWTWEACDRVVDQASARGLSLCVLLHGYPPKYEFTTEEGIQRYCEYVRAVVTRYRDRVKHWELWNEPNIQYFWVGTPEQYAALLKAAYQACKEADPECTVLGICTAGTDLKFIERILKAAGPQVMDLLVIHPYRYPRTPERNDLIGEIRRAAETARRVGPARRIWITEVGYPTDTGPYGSTEVRQAQMLVRTYLECLASGEVDKVFWHIHRDGDEGFGVVRMDMSPRPSYLALATMTGQLCGLRFVRALAAGEGDRAYLFQGQGRSVLAAWNAHGGGCIALAPSAQPVTVTDMAGRARLLPAGRPAALALTGSPVFIACAGEPPALGEPPLRAHGPAEISLGEEVRVSVVARNGAAPRAILRVAVGVTRRAAARLSGTIEAIPPAEWRGASVSQPLALEAGAAKRFTLTVRPATDVPTGDYAVQVKWTAGDATWVASAPVRLRPLVEDIPGIAAPPREAVITIRNTSSRRALDPARITFTTDAGRIRRQARIAPSGDAQFTVPLLPEGETPFPYRKLPLKAQVRAGDTTARWDETFYCGACGPAPRVSIDGRLDEWQALPWVTLDKLGDIVERRPGAWRGPADLSARIWTAWDERAFYVAAEVRDDVHGQQWGGNDLTGREIRRGDCLRFAVDPQPRRDSTLRRGYEYGLAAKGQAFAGLTAGEFLGWKMSAPVIRGYEYGLALTFKGSEAYRYYSPDGRQEAPAPGLEAVVVRDGEFTRYEAAVPWSALEPLRPQVGRWFGFALLLNDEDGSEPGSYARWGEGFGGQYRNPDARLFGRLVFREGW